MKKIKRWLKEIFNPSYDMDIFAIGEALNDHATRAFWLADVLEQIRDMNIEVDKKLLISNEYGLINLCAKRQAYKDILQAVLSARRKVQAGEVTQTLRHNPKVSDVNLDRVTA